MALSDPFETAYAGAYKAASSLGEGISSAAGDFAKQQELKNSQARALSTLKMLQGTGLKQETIPLTTDEYNKQAENTIRTNADKLGASDLQIAGSDNPEERRKQYQAILEPLGLDPKPKSISKLDMNEMANKFDISLDSDGKLSYKIKTIDPLTEELKQQRLLDVKNRNEDRDLVRQDRLEKQSSDMMNKIVNARSGGLGLQDSKVNQAIDLRRLVDESKDPATGEYKIPPAFQTELVLGLARLISPNGNVGIELEKELATKTAQEGLAKMAIYFGADPKKVGGAPQDVVKFYLDAIDRQGSTAEDLRNKYMEGIKTRADFKGLSPAARDRILNSEVASSFKDYLKTGKVGRSEAASTLNASGLGSSQSSKSSQESIDMSTMSDDQLKAIINGQ